MLNCREATRLFSESQEGSLSLTERMSLKIHIFMCTGCANFGQQMRTIRQVTRAFAKGENERTDKD